MTNKLFRIFTLLLTTSFLVNGETLFEDDFSNEIQSNHDWSLINPEYLELSFVEGALKIKNTSDSSANGVYYEPGIDYGTFTYSVKITFDEGQPVGIAFCIPSDFSSFYSFLIDKDGNYQYGKPGEQNKAGYSSYINPVTNVVKVSKKDSEANIFVNGYYLTTIEVSQSSGDYIGLLLVPQSSAIYDNVKLTDEFMTGSKPSSFEDDFEDGVLTGWSGVTYMNNGNLNENDGKLFLNTTEVSDSFTNSIRTEVNPGDDFVFKTEISHKGGDVNRPYGLSLWGKESEQRVFFCITADGNYGAINGYVQFELKSSNAIWGKAYVSSGSDTTYFIDTLEVVKRKGVDDYYFVINKDTVTRVSGVDFDIIQAGIECNSKLELEIDNFSIKDSSSVNIVRRRQDLNRSKVIQNSNTVIFDILGRNTGKRFNYMNRKLKTSPGLYLSKNYKGKIIFKKR